ncbi:MAG: FkbM family methyltransferase [Armatimonadota bacterium]|nr:FkbM family methyltransferase [Armatimonadota bacterium]
MKRRLEEVRGQRDFFRPSTRRDRLQHHPVQTLVATAFSRAKRFTNGKICARVRARTFWGDVMHVLLPEGSPIYYWGLIDGEEFNLTCFMVDRLGIGQTVIDVGAHFGYYTLLASALVGETGGVHAFEPTPRTFSILAANTSGRQGAIVHQKAMWKAEQTLMLVDFGPQAGAFNTLLSRQEDARRNILERYGRTASVLPVEATTLDAYCRERGVRPSFIKIDAEGAEYQIVLGATTVLRCQPVLSVEIWGREGRLNNAERIMGLLRDFSYEPCSLRQGRLTAYRFDPERDFVNVVFGPR